MSTRLSGALSRIIPGVVAYFGGDKVRPLVVTLVAGDPDRPDGIYLRGLGQTQAKSRIITWNAAIQWATRLDGARARKYYQEPRDKNPDYARVYVDLVRVLSQQFPDDWQPRLAVLGLRPPVSQDEVFDDGLVSTPGAQPQTQEIGDDIPLGEALANINPTWRGEPGDGGQGAVGE